MSICVVLHSPLRPLELLAAELSKDLCHGLTHNIGQHIQTACTDGARVSARGTKQRQRMRGQCDRCVWGWGGGRVFCGCDEGHQHICHRPVQQRLVEISREGCSGGGVYVSLETALGAGASQTPLVPSLHATVSTRPHPGPFIPPLMTSSPYMYPKDPTLLHVV